MDDFGMALQRRRGVNPVRKALGNALVTLGTGQPQQDTEEDDYIQKLYAQEAIKQQFQDPTVRQLREAEISALQQPPPQGFVRVGKQVLNDPNYIKPEEQRKIDEANAQKEAEVESIRNSSQQAISNIEEAKKGAKYFGFAGDLPTRLAPSSILPGEYDARSRWESNVKQLLSQKVVDLIAEMKRVSKTGATGFGQLSEREGDILRQASTALNQNVSPQYATQLLDEMEKIHKKVLGGGQTQEQQPQAPVSVGQASYDPDKEARYQAWKQSQTQGR